MQYLKASFLVLFLLMVNLIFAQSGTIRGNVYDKGTGNPIAYANIYLENTNFGVTTDDDGFFSMTNVPKGNYSLVASFIGYETKKQDVELLSGQIKYIQLSLDASGIGLAVVDISAKRERARSETQVSVIKVSPKEIKALPAIGGEADILQYLQVLPGIIATGDQGGQLFIRGGSPVQNKITLDGLTIINPFHSIGSFSVFETELISNVDVLTGGFNVEHGSRVSAVVDIKTRPGNGVQHESIISVSPFMYKLLAEGPIIKFSENKDFSMSYILTTKQSLIDKTAKYLYPYINASDSIGLPYKISDFYGKLSMQLGSGSKIDLFGFDFSDRYFHPRVADINWDNSGGGIKFKVIPSNSSIMVDAGFGYTAYETEMISADGLPRFSEINHFSTDVDFTYFGEKIKMNYGLEFNSIYTNFEFTNPFKVSFQEFQNTTEMNGYIKLTRKWLGWIIEPGLRAQFYASLGDFELEPRLSIKYNINESIRFKASGGLYSQNLISTSTERDVVNIFVGFISSPEERVYDPFTENNAVNKLQKAKQAVLGIEFTPLANLDINLEGYYKSFDQLIVVNRNKLSLKDPNYVVEHGNAYGMDVSAKYELSKLYFWLSYSLSWVQRDDAEQVYPTVFDRRHNLNFISSATFGKNASWEASARWNLGSGFPFTKTQAFFNQFQFINGANTDYETDNPDFIGVIYSDVRNGGRLPYYHRLDLALKKTIKLSSRSRLEIQGSVTNVYNRQNIFYFDRLKYERVNQLPILPSLGLTWYI
jgi:hypothetical protein